MQIAVCRNLRRSNALHATIRLMFMFPPFLGYNIFVKFYSEQHQITTLCNKIITVSTSHLSPTSNVLAEQECSQTAEMKEKIKIENLLSCAGNMHYEIKTRYDILTAKCTIDIDKLIDYKILNFKKREDSINSELCKLIDKTSSFETFVLPCGDAAADTREVVKSNHCITDLLL